MRPRGMNLGQLARDTLQMAFRLLPWPTEPGLRTAGNPGPLSPVVVTGNYDLTVRRVLRALREVDAWLDRFRAEWQPRLDALATEIARGKRARRP